MSDEIPVIAEIEARDLQIHEHSRVRQIVFNMPYKESPTINLIEEVVQDLPDGTPHLRVDKKTYYVEREITAGEASEAVFLYGVDQQPLTEGFVIPPVINQVYLEKFLSLFLNALYRHEKDKNVGA